MNRQVLTRLFLILLATFLSGAFINCSNADTENLLIGEWVSETDSNWRIEFDYDGRCFWHYEGEPTDEFEYNLSNESLQCGYSFPKADGQYEYLRLTDREGRQTYCYEVLGIDQESLSLRTIDLGVKNFIFIRN
ncbi:hypothetical protein [Gilvibacter sediminis]|uniref:hypothetical protein n=1 Tax=Gilvibacter sediminis TaxID=379071 RepID=UPI002350F242|nr:hypothetical protein [Gilvibacter sediminis]MDC7998639.1 hypothetical protein [Gilvibacter sediminis]